MDIAITETEIIAGMICAMIVFAVIPGILVLYSRIMDYLTDTAGLPMAAYQTGNATALVAQAAQAVPATEHIVRIQKD